MWTAVVIHVPKVTAGRLFRQQNPNVNNVPIPNGCGWERMLTNHPLDYAGHRVLKDKAIRINMQPPAMDVKEGITELVEHLLVRQKRHENIVKHVTDILSEGCVFIKSLVIGAKNLEKPLIHIRFVPCVMLLVPKKIGTHESEREMCLACATTKRFWAGEYCYRCDTGETPDVILDDEIAGCTACPQRNVMNGKCVLNK